MLKEKHSKISIQKAIEQINKMYGVELWQDNGNPQLIKLKNNGFQQEILNIITQYI
jgi:hypothetical protein